MEKKLFYYLSFFNEKLIFTMAITVNKPSSSNYPTKLPSTAPPVPCRDHQHNKNQTFPTITTQDQAINISHVFPVYQEDPVAPIKDTPGFTDSYQDTTQDQAFDSASISDQKDPFAPYKPGFTPQRTKNHDNFYEMTLEEQMQQYDDE